MFNDNLGGPAINTLGKMYLPVMIPGMTETGKFLNGF